MAETATWSPKATDEELARWAQYPSNAAYCENAVTRLVAEVKALRERAAVLERERNAFAVLEQREVNRADAAERRAVAMEIDLDLTKACEATGRDDACGECLACLKAIAAARQQEVVLLRDALSAERPGVR